jgi:hypothetical protein
MVEALLIQLTNKKTQTHPLTPPYKGGEQNESDCQFSSHQSRVNEPNDQLSSHQSSENDSTPPLMTCRYCLRQALGFCTKSPASQKLPWKEPLSLRLADGRRFPLRFDCKNCLMLVLTPNT